MNHGRPDYNRRIVDLEGLIPEDEPVFFMRAQDMASAQAVRAYARIVAEIGRMRGTDPAVIQRVFSRALDQADAMERYAATHGVKMPD